LAVSSHFLRKWLQKKWEEDPSLHTVSSSDPLLDTDRATPLLAQALTLYQIFLEHRQRGIRLLADECQFAISRFDGRLYVKKAHEAAESTGEEEAWLAAIHDLAGFLQRKATPQANWCLARFLFLANSAAPEENELLDLLGLLEAEFQLEEGPSAGKRSVQNL
jgi:hypothetical protein